MTANSGPTMRVLLVLITEKVRRTVLPRRRVLVTRLATNEETSPLLASVWVGGGGWTGGGGLVSGIARNSLTLMAYVPRGAPGFTNTVPFGARPVTGL